MPYVTTWERRAEMKGQEKGIALGKREGIIEEKTEIAKRLLSESISLDIICRTTGLSRSEVESLQAEEPVH